VLVVAFGLISIFSKNDIFFKIKPAIIEAIMVVFFVVPISRQEMVWE